MHPRYMTERITLLKSRVGENCFGERVEEYVEIGKGWAAIRFKSVDKDARDTNGSIIYQVTMQRPVPRFHRLIWRGQIYTIKYGAIAEGNHSVVTLFIKAI